MSRAEEPVKAWPPLQDGGGPKETQTSTHKRRNLSLANISIPSPFTNLSILKRKPLPANSPVAAQQRSLSLDSPKLPVPRAQNLLTPILSPGQVQLAIRDLDR